MGLMISRFLIRSVFAPVIGVAAWLAGQQPALAQTSFCRMGIWLSGSIRPAMITSCRH